MKSRFPVIAIAALVVAGTLPAAEDAPVAEDPAGVVTPVPVPDEAAARLTARLTELWEQSALPGFAVAVVTADGPAYLHGFGWADLEQRVPYTPTTIQPIASVSKTVIGVCLMHAVEHGRVTLDTPVAGLVGFPVAHPEYPAAAITLRQLATHTSGIVDRPAAYREAYAPGQVPNETLRDYEASYLDPAGRRFSRGNFSPHAPGEAHAYTNIGAALAALALETPTGSAFTALSRDVVFDPLGMKDTTWWFDAAKADRHAVLYDSERRPIAPYVLVTYPDGGLHTTASDLALYLVEMIKGSQGKGRLLLAATYAALFAPQFDGRAPPQGVGAGEPNSGIFWAINPAGDIGHNGGDPGVATLLSFRPSAGIGVIFLTNISVEGPAAGRHVSLIAQALRDYGATSAKR